MIETSRRPLGLGAIAAAALLTLTISNGLDAQTPSAAGAGWTSLFDGKTLTGWRGYRQPDATATRWVVNDGLLCVDPKSRPTGRDIVTVNTYRDFELRWEWRVPDAGNSGVKYLVLEDQPSAIGHEYQMADDARNADARSGGLHSTASYYDVLPPGPNRPLRPAGQFNESRIVLTGTKAEHWLNGTKVLEYDMNSAAVREGILKSKFAKIERFGKPHDAHILLQDHNDAACFRNIMIKAGK
jgi:hypothetical protein